jgi:hypothetical protein
MDMKSLSVRDIGSKFISPAIANRGRGLRKPVGEKIGLIKGGIVVRGKSPLNLLRAATLSDSTFRYPLLNNTLLPAKADQLTPLCN